MADRAALVTNVTDYAGLPGATALSSDGFRVFCHDPSFGDPAARDAFTAGHAGLEPLAGQTPEALVADVVASAGRLDVIVSNDSHPATRARIEQAEAQAYRDTLEALMVWPFRLAGAATPVMKGQGGGRIVFITSASPLHPYPGFSMYASARAGASALSQALARELAPHGIQVNAIAPNFLYSETYYPRAQWMEDPKYVQRLKDMVPMQRLGRPEEIGALIGFLASGKAEFVTGQVIAFTGGWP